MNRNSLKFKIIIHTQAVIHHFLLPNHHHNKNSHLNKSRNNPLFQIKNLIIHNIRMMKKNRNCKKKNKRLQIKKTRWKLKKQTKIKIKYKFKIKNIFQMYKKQRQNSILTRILIQSINLKQKILNRILKIYNYRMMNKLFNLCNPIINYNRIIKLMFKML